MIKRIVLTVIEFAAFLGFLYIGGNWDGVNLTLELQQMQRHETPHVFLQTMKYDIGATHFLIANGILFATVLLVLLLLVQLLTKTAKPGAIFTLAAYAVALAIALAVPGWAFHAV